MSNNYNTFYSGQITEEESLFTYPPGKTYSDYYFPNHNAPLLSEVVANALDVDQSRCNDNKQCIFDFVHTNKLEIGKATTDSIKKIIDDILIASKTI